jgi:hypothetical protein
VLHVMPVQHDVHRACGAECFADKAPTVAGQARSLSRISSRRRHSTIALAGRALNAAGHVTVGDLFCRRTQRVFLGRS